MALRKLGQVEVRTSCSANTHTVLRGLPALPKLPALPVLPHAASRAPAPQPYVPGRSFAYQPVSTTACQHNHHSCSAHTQATSGRDEATGQDSSSLTTNSRAPTLAGLGAVALGTTLLVSMLAPGSAVASEGELTGQSVEMFKTFMAQVESLGPWGSLLFVLTVMLFEMVPLFPTQPLSLASGLLFGTQQGAALMLLGVTLAATNAFLIARGVGRPLAQKVIDAEMSHASDGGKGGAVAKTLADVQAAIEGGGFWKQLTAIALLRLTPVVPFSASNYLLGLTPVQLPAFMAGTLVGMSVWSTVYAGLGGASRALLNRGADIETLMSDLGSKASALSTNAVGLTASVAAVGALLWVVKSVSGSSSDGSSSSSSNSQSGDAMSDNSHAHLHNGSRNGNGNGAHSSSLSQQHQQRSQAEMAGGDDDSDSESVTIRTMARSRAGSHD